MHPSAHAQMARCVETYMPKGRRYDVVDFGSRVSRKRAGAATHRDLLREHDCDVVGVDIRAGHNVDVVMRKPYRIPLKANSADIVFAGQVFEHIPFFWASFLEIARVLRPTGYLFLTVPSRGHEHAHFDCWRYYPDGLRALAAFARLEICEAHTDFPPTGSGRRHDFARIDSENRYWGDTVGVFRKPVRRRSPAVAIVREVLVWWANRVGDVGSARVLRPTAT
jgi:SAM-dependent methyltransferase